MKIVLAGGSGFIGEPLASRLASRDGVRNDVVVLTRDPSKIRRGRGVVWNPPLPGDWSRELADADVIINLAGENIGGGRWNDARKRRLTASRLDATSALVDALRANPRATDSRLRFISASAIGYYGPRGDESLDETGRAGDDFLANLTKRWEEAAHAADALADVVILRFGIVLASNGGALAKMLMPFRLGLGGPVGSGDQWMSWIDRDDVVRLIEWLIDRDDVRDLGVINATAPNPVTNREFTKALGRALHRPAFVPVPAFALRLAFGEMADLLLTGQRVTPACALAKGFRFEFETIGASLTHAVQRSGSNHNN